MLLYLGSSTDSYDRVPDRGTTLSNVYVDPSYWKDFPYTHAVYAKPVGGSVGCATFASANKMAQFDLAVDVVKVD